VNRRQVTQTVFGEKMTIPAALKRSQTRSPEKPAIVFGERSWTYAELDELTDTLSANLLVAGLEPGDRVAFHFLNGPELALGCVGCMKAGCIAVPINTRLKGAEIDYILRHSGSACYIGQAELYTEVARSCPALGSLELRYLTGDLPDGEVNSFDDLLLAPAGSGFVRDISDEQLAAILYTSGTTARPKGVMHSHEGLVQTAHTASYGSRQRSNCRRDVIDVAPDRIRNDAAVRSDQRGNSCNYATFRPCKPSRATGAHS
jgi:long-chain acyl-CoA synthetase